MIRLHGFIDKLEQMVSADQLMQPFELVVREDTSVHDATRLLCENAGVPNYGFGLVRDHRDNPAGIFPVPKLESGRLCESLDGGPFDDETFASLEQEVSEDSIAPIADSAFFVPASSIRTVRRGEGFSSVLQCFGESTESNKNKPKPPDIVVVEDAGKLIGYISISELLSGPAALLLFAHVRELEAAAVDLCTAFPKLWDELDQPRMDKAIKKYEEVFAPRAKQVGAYFQDMSELCHSQEKLGEAGFLREYIQATELCDKKVMLQGEWSLPGRGKPENKDIRRIFEVAEKIRNFVAHPVSKYMFDERLAWQYIDADDSRERIGNSHVGVPLKSATALEKLTPKRIWKFLRESKELLKSIDSELDALRA